MNISISKSSHTSVYDKARRAATTLAGMTVPVIIKLQMAFAENGRCMALRYKVPGTGSSISWCTGSSR